MFGSINSSKIVWSIIDSYDHENDRPETIYCADGDGMLQIVYYAGSDYIVLDQSDPIATFDNLHDALEFGQDKLEIESPEIFEKRMI